MHVDDNIKSIKDPSRRRVLLRTSYRDGKQVKKTTVANITGCTDEEIEAIKVALKHKGDLAALEKLAGGSFENGRMVGAVAALKQTADALGITGALGNTRQAKLVLWLVMARLLGQGSRLSAVRLAEIHAGCEILGIDSLNEDDLYQALDWLDENQDKIQKRLFARYRKSRADSESNPDDSFYLYDVSSSYLEGIDNDLAAWGYNRDGKKGKMQIVYGLLTGDDGEPLSIEAFAGNTGDTATVANQVARLKNDFGCKHVTLVGDKGMIRGPQQEELTAEGFNYLTSITKSEIRKLMSIGTLQLELFDVGLCEVIDRKNGVRYVLRKNPARADEIGKSRASKIDAITGKMEKANLYLSEHPGAKPAIQLRNLRDYAKKLKMGKYIFFKIDDAVIQMSIDRESIEKDAGLDGCYAIKTDLPPDVGTADKIHNRYKDLAKVESGFRTMKTEHLEVRPIFLRRENRTRAHLFVTMLAYKIERRLRKSWEELNLTVEEGIERLKSVTSLVLTIGNEKIIRLPKLNGNCQALVNKLGIILPDALPCREVKVVTRKTLAKSG